MSIQVKKSTMVFPAKETPKKSVWLSNLDLIRNTFNSHVPNIFIYSPKKMDPKNGSKFFDSEIMKESLSRILVPYYPVAGRLRKNPATGRIEIDCNAAGALYIEAEATTRLDLDDFEGIGLEGRKLVIPTCDYSGGISSFPLLIAQITRFKCGSVCICFAVHHHVADGQGHYTFINSWARLAKGVVELGVSPSHDRDVYLAPRHPPQVKFHHSEYEQPALSFKSFSDQTETAKECMFKICKDQIDMLKLEASTSQCEEVERYKLSTFEVLAGHIWRCTCKARGLTRDQDVKLYIPTDGRSRLKDSSLPQVYFGNVVFFTTCTAKVREITEKPLWYAASKVQEVLKRVDNVEYLRSAIDYLELQSDLTSCARGPHCFACPNLSINSWARLPLHEADFGWGRPNFVGRGGIRFEGESYIVPSPKKDGSFSLYIKLFTSHLPLFKNYLYAWPDKRLCKL